MEKAKVITPEGKTVEIPAVDLDHFRTDEKIALGWKVVGDEEEETTSKRGKK